MTALALFAETKVFELDNDRDRKTIVDLRHVDVGRFESRGAKCVAARVDRAGSGELGVADMAVTQTISLAEKMHRLALQIVRARGRGDNSRRGTVRDKRAIEDMQW